MIDESRKRFGEAFHAINANFRDMFGTLFGGGMGEMRLTDEENLARVGYRHRRFASRQAAAERTAAFGRRESR